MSSYPLYSSLMFHCSQAPISITAKRLTQPRFLSFPCSAKTLTISASQVSFPRTVMRQLHSTFWPQVSWRPETKYIGRIILHQQSPFNPYLFYSPIPVSTPLTLTIPVLLDPKSCDLWFRLLFICDLLSIKAAPLLYYTSVLISTKITTIFSL